MRTLNSFVLCVTSTHFAGDKGDSKSTSGMFVALTGPHSFFPLAAASRKQTAVANSTPEAEVVAAYHAMAVITAAYDAVRLDAVPLLDLVEAVFNRTVSTTLYEDNQSCIAIIKSGRFQKSAPAQGLTTRRVYAGGALGI